MGTVAGDPVALESFKAVGTWLGPGDVPAKLTGRGHRLTATVRVAQLGQGAGLIGAADLART